MGFREEYPRDETFCHPIMKRQQEHDSSPGTLTLIIVVKVVISRFLHCKITIAPFLCSTHWK